MPIYPALLTLLNGSKSFVGLNETLIFKLFSERMIRAVISEAEMGIDKSKQLDFTTICLFPFLCTSMVIS